MGRGRSRSSTRTSCPPATSASTTCEPMKPAPPDTRIIVATLRHRALSPRVQVPEDAQVIDLLPYSTRPRPCRGCYRAFLPASPRWWSTMARATDRRSWRARLGAQVVREPRRGFGAACWAGLCAAESELVGFMDGDGSLDPGELPAVAAPVLAGQADLSLGAPTTRARRLAGPRPPGQPPAHAGVAPPLRCPPARLGPDARGLARRAARARPARPGLRLAAGDGPARRRSRLADQRGPCLLRSTGRAALEGERQLRGTIRTVRAMSAELATRR